MLFSILTSCDCFDKHKPVTQISWTKKMQNSKYLNSSMDVTSFHILIALVKYKKENTPDALKTLQSYASLPHHNSQKLVK